MSCWMASTSGSVGVSTCIYVCECIQSTYSISKPITVLQVINHLIDEVQDLQSTQKDINHSVSQNNASHCTQSYSWQKVNPQQQKNHPIFPPLLVAFLFIIFPSPSVMETFLCVGMGNPESHIKREFISIQWMHLTVFGGNCSLLSEWWTRAVVHQNTHGSRWRLWRKDMNKMI